MLGNRLQYFQVGNEADLFDRHLRDPKTWSAQTYLEEWLTLARAITARVPTAKFGMPEVKVISGTRLSGDALRLARERTGEASGLKLVEAFHEALEEAE